MFIIHFECSLLWFSTLLFWLFVFLVCVFFFYLFFFVLGPKPFLPGSVQRLLKRRRVMFMEKEQRGASRRKKKTLVHQLDCLGSTLPLELAPSHRIPSSLWSNRLGTEPVDFPGLPRFFQKNITPPKCSTKKAKMLGRSGEPLRNSVCLG